MSEWKKVKIKNSDIQIIDGDRSNKYPKREEFQEKGIMFLNAASINGHGLNLNSVNYITLEKFKSIKKGRVNGEDLIMTTRGNGVGDIAFYSKKNGLALINAQMLILRTNQETINSNFLYYLFKTNYYKEEFINYSSGSAQPQLPITSLKEIYIVYPKLDIQCKIASILSAYDDLIENNLKRIKLLEELAQRTYEEWFVKFRINGEQLEVGANGLPDGWERKKLVDIVEINNGFAFKANQFNSDGKGMPIIRIRNIPNSNTNDFTTEKVDNKFLVDKGDLLVGMDGEFYINNWSGPKAYLVQRSCNIKVFDKFYHGYLSQAIVKPIKFFEATISGATVAHLGKKHLDTIDIVIPSEEFNKNIKQFNDWLDLKINLGYQNRLLKESRDILLPRLMSGKIGVENDVLENVKNNN